MEMEQKSVFVSVGVADNILPPQIVANQQEEIEEGTLISESETENRIVQSPHQYCDGKASTSSILSPQNSIHCHHKGSVSHKYSIEEKKTTLDDHFEVPTFEGKKHMKRSLSVPANVKTKSLRMSGSTRHLIRVISTSAQLSTDNNALPPKLPETHNATTSAEDMPGEDIAEEEAICRICFEELGEGGESFKMECSCKGDLALAHKKCILKWFDIKGNTICDVCKRDVKNLPVTLLRIHSFASTTVGRQLVQPRQQQHDVYLHRIWKDVPILLLISMLAYFCFLEQILVCDMGAARSIVLSLPLASGLALLSTLMASTMVSKSYIWAYATFEFAGVLLFAYIFHTVLNVNAILSILLSTFTGFGITFSANSLLVEYLRWRSTRRIQVLQLSPQNSNADGRVNN